MVENRYVHTVEIHNKTAPAIIVPEIIRLIHPKSVVDVGCGTGTFLSIFQEHGVQEVLGIEGAWLEKSKLEVAEDLVILKDLEKPLTYPKRFDLALCLEVVEHLSEASADTIVDTLTDLSDVIVFSAASPFQHGQNHINLQWTEYWEKKFAAKGYKFYDELRNKFWDNKNVEWWYKQNMFIIIKNGKNTFNFSEDRKVKDLIHPDHNFRIKILLSLLFSGKMSLTTVISRLLKRLGKSK